MGILINILILATAIPVGLLLAALTKEELAPGKKWFKLFSAILVVLIIVGGFLSWSIPIVLSLIYLLIMVLISLLRG